MKSRYLRGQLKELPIAIGFIGMGVLFFISTTIALGIIAAVLFFICAAMIVEDYLLAQRGCRAQAVVVDFRSEEDSFFPIVEFQDRRGETRRVTTKTGRGIKSPPCGSRVVVIYDPEGKNRCEIDSFFRRWGAALMIAGLGCAFVIGAMTAK